MFVCVCEKIQYLNVTICCYHRFNIALLLGSIETCESIYVGVPLIRPQAK